MNFDKIVKLACKPKSAAPKTKVPFFSVFWAVPRAHCVSSIWTLLLPQPTVMTERSRKSVELSHQSYRKRMLSYVLIATVPRCSWTSRPVDFSEQVVFKALIVLHTMIRNGHTDNILNYIASSDTLRLRQVANGERHGERSYPIILRASITQPSLCLQVIPYQRTPRIMPYISKPVLVPTAISSMMQSVYNPKTIATGICPWQVGAGQMANTAGARQ